MSLLFFTATSDFVASLDVVDDIANTLTTPAAMASGALQTTNAISCAAVVLISGYFESFLKDIVEQVVTDYNKAGKGWASLPYDVKARHLQSGAVALNALITREKRDNTSARSEDLARRLGSMSSAKFELVWEAFAQTRSNPGPDTVGSILGGLQIEKGWEQINKLVTMHGNLNTFLDTFIQIRNVCAHTGSHSSPPTGTEILEYTEKFRVIAECIDFLLQLQLESVYSKW